MTTTRTVEPTGGSTVTVSDPEVIGISPLTPRIGAIIGGVRLSGDLGPHNVEAIRTALHRHKVVFFRGQQHLTDAAQVAFTSRLGPPVGHPLVDQEGLFVHPITSEYGGLADQWHTDLTFMADFPSASVLRAIVLPETGGDTIWADTASAYEDLTPALQELAVRLRVVHSNAYDYAALARDRESEAYAWYREMAAAAPMEAEHPLVCVHPVSGERTLLLGDFAQRIVGHTRDQSDLLMRLFQTHITRVENTVRWSWRPGDVAIWDNRATQHRAVADFGDVRRILHRTTVAGEVARGADGRLSVRIAAVGGDVAGAGRGTAPG
ncbi:TauD/TfdA dioxygenase family protein [Yinghuangia sp. YIM S09857]|uniref:TauD/TfdA dioxygenase family protein n=1 Tax=Yinghuangia sp. YIM S09857 TaxID=3436929 RepID=UPI003F536842